MLRHVTGARVKGESQPRRPSHTAWESSPALFVQPALCGHPDIVWILCGKADVIP
jgi:hypothetical protein